MNATLPKLPPVALLEDASAPAATLPLSRLAPGQSGVVHAVDASSPIGRRLFDLGFRPGTPLRVVRRAPLGDPTTYELRGSRFCLRRAEADRVAVSLAPRPRADRVVVSRER